MSGKVKKNKAIKRAVDERTQGIASASLKFIEELSETPAFSAWLRQSDTFRNLVLKIASAQNDKLDKALQAAFGSGDEAVRLIAAQILAISGSSAAMRFLVQQSSRSEPAIRYDAVMGLVKALPNPQAIEVVWKAREDADFRIKVAVESALAKLSPPQLEAIGQIRERLAQLRSKAARTTPINPLLRRGKKLTTTEFYHNSQRMNVLRARPSTKERPDRDELYPK